MPYGNFKDPIGLITRMIMSGNRAAYAALLRASCQVIVAPLDILMSAATDSTTAASTAECLPLFLIVGPPRAGTTLVYQYLARVLDVTYPTNLSSLFPRSAIALTPSSRFRQKEFDSYFGQTAGLNEPNDGFFIWNRWFGVNRFRTTTDLSSQQADAMQRFFAGWTQRTGRPFLNKNNRNCHCLAVLANSLPQAKFIIVNRDPASIVRSLVRARRTVQGSERIGWGLLSRQEVHHSGRLGYMHDVCEQVVQVNQLLLDQCASIEAQRITKVTYEEFCASPFSLPWELVNDNPTLAMREFSKETTPEKLSCAPTCLLTHDEEQVIAQFFPT